MEEEMKIQIEEILNVIWDTKNLAVRNFAINTNELIINCSMDLYMKFRTLSIDNFSVTFDPKYGSIKYIFGMKVYPTTSMIGDEWIISKKI